MKFDTFKHIIFSVLLMGNLEAAEVVSGDANYEDMSVANETAIPRLKGVPPTKVDGGIFQQQSVPLSDKKEIEEDKAIFTGEDVVLFHIINETSKSMPISLSLTIWDENKRPVFGRVNLDSITKTVFPNSKCTFMESECVLWKWFADSYKLKQPQNCDFFATINFNSGFFGKKVTPGRFSCSSTSHVVDLRFYTAGVTYKIVPDNYMSHLDEPVESFEIKRV